MLCIRHFIIKKCTITQDTELWTPDWGSDTVPSKLVLIEMGNNKAPCRFCCCSVSWQWCINFFSSLFLRCCFLLATSGMLLCNYPWSVLMTWKHWSALQDINTVAPLWLHLLTRLDSWSDMGKTGAQTANALILITVANEKNKASKVFDKCWCYMRKDERNFGTYWNG